MTETRFPLPPGIEETFANQPPDELNKARIEHWRACLFLRTSLAAQILNGLCSSHGMHRRGGSETTLTEVAHESACQLMRLAGLQVDTDIATPSVDPGSAMEEATPGFSP